MQVVKSRQDIIDELTSQVVNGHPLSEVFNSLVGKELLYYAGTVLHQLSVYQSELVSLKEISRSSLPELVASAYANDLTISLNRPASVTVTLPSQSSGEVVYAPFSLSASVGSAMFYNVDFVRSGETFDLVQGSLQYSLSKGSGVYDVFPALRNVSTSTQWTLYKEVLSSDASSTYLKLGNYAYPQSVWVFSRATNSSGAYYEFPFTRYEGNLRDKASNMYLVKVGWDYSVNVYFGNSQWANDPFNQGDNDVQVCWLNLTFTNFTLPSNFQVLDLEQNEVPVEVITSSVGERSSLTYAKEMFGVASGRVEGVVTLAQIQSYLNSLSSVNSSIVEEGERSVLIYVKPKKGLSKFQFIEDFLDLYGVPGVSYQVQVSTPVVFDVSLTPVGNQGVLEMSSAISYLNKALSYDKLKLTDVISNSILQSELGVLGVTSVRPELVVSDDVHNQYDGYLQLSSLPVPNTFKVAVPSGRDNVPEEVLAFDSDGVIKQITTQGAFSGTIQVSPLGDYLFVCNSSKQYLMRWNAYYWDMVEVTGLLKSDVSTGLAEGRFDRYSLSFKTYVASGRVTLFTSIESFNESDVSLFVRPSAQVASYSATLAGVTPDTQAVYLNGSLYVLLSGKVLRYEWDGEGWQQTESAISSESVTRFIVLGDYIISFTSGSSVGVFDTTKCLNYETCALTVPDISLSNIKDILGVTSSTVHVLHLEGDVVKVTEFSVRVSLNSRQVQFTRVRVIGSSDNVEMSAILGYRGSFETIMNEENNVFSVLGLSEGTREVEPFNNPQVYQVSGNIDYNTGKVYGLSVKDSQKISYKVYGTLTGGSTYPELGKVYSNG